MTPNPSEIEAGSPAVDAGLAAGTGGDSASIADLDETGLANDPILNRLVEELTVKLQAGDPVVLSEYAARYPEQADRLARLWPALRMMANLSHSAVADLRRDEPVSGIDPALAELGDYRLVRELGRGGMGIVYEAEQVSLGRRVALKVLPFAAALDPSQLRRFQTEAHAAAQLHHTNIVPVFSVGCERGVHYYAMQFIDGRTLAQIILDQKRAEPPRSGTVLAAFRTQCPGDDRRPRPVPAGRRAGHPGRRGARSRPSPGDRPPRHQARQLAAGRPRQPLDHRLRPGAVAGRGGTDHDGRPAGYAPLHEPGAGAGPSRDGGPPHGHLRPGGDALRVVDAEAGGGGDRPAGAAAADRAGGADRSQADRSRRFPASWRRSS